MIDVVILSFKFIFTVEYVSGVDNEIADYLSRNPKWGDIDKDIIVEDDFGQNMYLEDHVKMVTTSKKYNNRIIEDPMI